MAKNSKIVDMAISARAPRHAIIMRDKNYADTTLYNVEKYYPRAQYQPITPSSLRRVLRAIAKMAGVEDIEAELYEAYMQEFMRQNKEFVETRRQLEEAQKQLKAWGNAFAFWQNDDHAVWDGETTASGTTRIAQAEEAERKARTK